MSGDQRRALVLDAAITEIAEHGYVGASTTAIARRSEISQPYLYALFPSKKDLFVAACDQVAEELTDVFSDRAGSRGSLQPMADAYRELSEDRRLLAFLLQAYAACGDREICTHVSAGMTRALETIEQATGASRTEIIRFIATGIYLTVAGAIDLPREWRPSDFG
jgi:AcrR family transcriptional regulator